MASSAKSWNSPADRPSDHVRRASMVAPLDGTSTL
jgi:hypothetical protein